MEVIFRTVKLQKVCCSEAECRKKFGQNSAKIMLRLSELAAAETLADMSRLPAARCHPLGGDRNGQFAVDLKHPHRLVFEIANNPVHQKGDGGIDLTKVTKIRIIEIGDYHG